MQSGKSPNTRPQGERFQNGVKEEEEALEEKGLFIPLTKPRSKGRFLEEAEGSVTLNLRLQFLWGSEGGSNDKLINNFPFSLLDLCISWVAEILCSLCL